MQKITFVLPSRNNLEFLKLAYKSIRDLETKHEVLVLDDASVDGTQEWITSLNDEDLITYYNPGPERIGIVGMFDKGIEMARTEIIFAFHADMVAAPKLDKNILKHLKPGVVVSATRIEPPLHPPGVEKITQDFGVEDNEFKWNEFNEFCLKTIEENKDKTTEGIFAPWCMYKSDFLGHDELFAPQSKEDSDLFNRFVLSGYKVIQSWDGLVYHFTSRGSRFNKHVGGGAGKNSNEWLYTTTKNGRNFIRKWGHFVKHDPYMKPIIPNKYNIGFAVHNCSYELLSALEPWCDRIYIDNDSFISRYVNEEQPNTTMDLLTRVMNIKSQNPTDYDDVIVEFDATKLTQQSYQLIQQLPEILTESGEIGVFELDIFNIAISSLELHTPKLLCKS
jgi:glycosyltransferase involved in cell wall biosynthesis